MRTPLLMVRKDLIRKARSPLGLLIVLAFPLMFAGIISMAFGGGETPRVHLLVENLDDNMLGNALISALSSDRIAEHFDVEIVGEEGLSRIEKGEGSALLRIPDRFTENLIEGLPTSLELIRNPAQGIMPEIAEQLAGVLTEVLDTASRVLREPLDTLSPYLQGNAPDISSKTVADISVAVHGSMTGAEDFLFPPVIELTSVNLGEPVEEDDAEDTDSGNNIFNIFLWVFPGMSVYALFLVGDLGMRDLLVEADAGTLRRQIQGPVRPATVLLGKALFSALLALISLIMLTLIGWIAASEPIDLLAYTTLSLALILAVVGSAAAIYGASGSTRRGTVVSSVIYLLMAFAGGSFLQIQALPALIQKIAPITPFYWGTQGYLTLLQDGGTLTDVLPSVGILAGIGLGFLALGALLLDRKLVRGGGS